MTARPGWLADKVCVCFQICHVYWKTKWEVLSSSLTPVHSGNGHMWWRKSPATVSAHRHPSINNRITAEHTAFTPPVNLELPISLNVHVFGVGVEPAENSRRHRGLGTERTTWDNQSSQCSGGVTAHFKLRHWFLLVAIQIQEVPINCIQSYSMWLLEIMAKVRLQKKIHSKVLQEDSTLHNWSAKMVWNGTHRTHNDSFAR